MSKIGCIVMYSKPLEKNKTVPRGTVFYTDGTEKEVSLKEAAVLALEMSMERGYENAIDNERYFNTSYKEFLDNKDKYKKIAKKKKAEVKKTTVEKTIEKKTIPSGIVEVEPPERVKDETRKKEEKTHSDEPELIRVEQPQVLYGPPPEMIETHEENKAEQEPELIKIEQPQVLYGPPPEMIETHEEDKKEVEPGDIDFEELEAKLEKVLEEAFSKDESEEVTEQDLMKMIDEQNKGLEEKSDKKR